MLGEQKNLIAINVAKGNDLYCTDFCVQIHMSNFSNFITCLITTRLSYEFEQTLIDNRVHFFNKRTVDKPLRHSVVDT